VNNESNFDFESPTTLVFDLAARLFDAALCNDQYRTTIAERMPQHALAISLGAYRCGIRYVPPKDEDLSFLRITSRCQKVYVVC
jgi:hypothetical protein